MNRPAWPWTWRRLVTTSAWAGGAQRCCAPTEGGRGAERPAKKKQIPPEKTRDSRPSSGTRRCARDDKRGRVRGKSGVKPPHSKRRCQPRKAAATGARTGRPFRLLPGICDVVPLHRGKRRRRKGAGKRNEKQIPHRHSQRTRLGSG